MNARRMMILGFFYFAAVAGLVFGGINLAAMIYNADKIPSVSNWYVIDWVVVSIHVVGPLALTAVGIASLISLRVRNFIVDSISVFALGPSQTQ